MDWLGHITEIVKGALRTLACLSRENYKYKKIVDKCVKMIPEPHPGQSTANEYAKLIKEINEINEMRKK